MIHDSRDITSNPDGVKYMKLFQALFEVRSDHRNQGFSSVLSDYISKPAAAFPVLENPEINDGIMVARFIQFKQRNIYSQALPFLWILT